MSASTILSWDLVWRRVSQLDDFRAYKQGDFRFAVVGKQFALGSGASSSSPVDFPSGAIILGIGGGISVSAVATAEIRGLNCIRLGLDYSGAKGSIISGGRINGAAIFGNTGNRLFPGKEIIMPKGDTITVGVDNLSTSAISFDIAFHTMIPSAIN
jgi:hypothetical protein